MNRLLNSTISLLIAVTVMGCDPYVPPEATASAPMQAQTPGQSGSSPFAESETEFLVMMVIDLSGSFERQMAEDGKAYEFFLRIYDQYFRNRIGCKDELIIAQLSGTHRSLLWRGSPMELRHKFGSSTEFKEFLMANRDPNGSVIHDGIAHALEYITSDPALASGKAQSAVFVLSDLLDNGANPNKSGQRVNLALAEYARKNGIVGLYYVDQELVLPWRQSLQSAGIRNYRVECIIDEDPELPSF